MSGPQQLAFIVAAGLALTLLTVLVMQVLGIPVDPLLVVGALVLLWVFGSGGRGTGTSGGPGPGGGTTNPEEERQALAQLQKKYADEVIEEHRAGKISTERRNELLRHILNAPTSESKGPGPRRPS